MGQGHSKIESNFSFVLLTKGPASRNGKLTVLMVADSLWVQQLDGGDSASINGFHDCGLRLLQQDCQVSAWFYSLSWSWSFDLGSMESATAEREQQRQWQRHQLLPARSISLLVFHFWSRFLSSQPSARQLALSLYLSRRSSLRQLSLFPFPLALYPLLL